MRDNMECPLGSDNPVCTTCPYCKEELCDYPWIGAVKCEAHPEEAPDAI